MNGNVIFFFIQINFHPRKKTTNQKFDDNWQTVCVSLLHIPSIQFSYKWMNIKASRWLTYIHVIQIHYAHTHTHMQRILFLANILIQVMYNRITYWYDSLDDHCGYLFIYTNTHSHTHGQYQHRILFDSSYYYYWLY